MYATSGDIAPATTSASSAAFPIAKYVEISSQTIMATIMIARPTTARRRSFIHAPIV